jgi:uncharacterized protein HemX
MQSMSSSSDEAKAAPARHVRFGLRRALAVAIVLLAISLGAVVLWEKYGGMDASSSTAADPTVTTAAATETAEVSDMTSQVLKELQSSQQQMAEKLEDIQRQLASEQGERRLLSEQLAALSSRVNALSASNASATTGMAAPPAKKRPAPVRQQLQPSPVR